MGLSRLKERVLEEHVELEMWCNAWKIQLATVIFKNENQGVTEELFQIEGQSRDVKIEWNTGSWIETFCYKDWIGALCTVIATLL